ncbi:MAG: hypothetical protein ACK47B_27965 [Armatimonadota bacterium]
MKKCVRTLGVAGVLLTACSAGPVLAEDPAPMPADKGQPAESQPVPPAKSREQEIEDLKRVIEELRRRVEELEKQQTTPTPPPVDPQPDPVPPPESPSGRPTPGGGATFLPNISVIGNLVGAAGDTKGIEGRGRTHLRELEVAFQDAVAPNLRYDAFLSAEKEEDWNVHLEEGYVTATGLLKGLNLRAGRMRSRVGRFNALHPHQWLFISQPSAHRALVGDHGLISDGALLEYLFPTRGFFAALEVGRWQNAVHGHGHEGEDEGHAEEEHEAGIVHEEDLGFRAGQNGAYSARLLFAKEVGRDRDLEIGFSRYWGTGEVEDFGRKRQALNAIDVSYRAYPGAYQRLWLLAELLAHETQGINGESKLRPGAFAMLAYRWNRYWEAGVRADYTKYPFPVAGKEYGASLFLTRYLNEQTSLRFEYRRAQLPEFGATNAVYVQLLFGSGPHTHPIQ